MASTGLCYNKKHHNLYATLMYMEVKMNKVATFSKRLEELRKEKGISQTQLAEALKISRQSIGFYEKDERSPDVEVIQIICRYFNVTSDYLIGLTDNRTPETASIGEVTGLTDEAIAALRYYKIVYKDSDNENNILPLVNFLLASDMTRVNTILLYDLLEREALTDDELMSDEDKTEKWIGKVIYDEKGKVILDKNIIDEYEKLCGKPKRGMPIFGELLRYFNTPVRDETIFLTEKGELGDTNSMKRAQGKYMYAYKQSEIIDQMCLSSIQQTLKYRKLSWQEQNNNGEPENGVK